MHQQSYICCLPMEKQEQYILEQEIKHDLKKDMGILKECVLFLMML